MGSSRGLDLKPYGRESRFFSACTDCHRPMRDNDYVYTLPITDARVKGNDVVNNSAAALPASLPYQPLAWNAITMYVDPQVRTMATLYGNDAAMQTVQARRTAQVGGTEARPIRLVRCWPSSHGRNATTRTGSGHESPGYRYPWNSWKWRPADRRTTVVSPARDSPRITPLLRRRSAQASRWDSFPRSCHSTPLAAHGRYAGGSGLRF